MTDDHVIEEHYSLSFKPAALDELWVAVPLSMEHVAAMAESHNCFGWDCRDCIMLRTVLSVVEKLDAAETMLAKVEGHMHGHHNCQWPTEGCEHGLDPE